METKRIDVLFGLTVIAFLVVTTILIKEVNYKRANDFKEYTAILSNIVKQKNDKIRVVANRLLAQQKENEDLKVALEDTRNSLDALSKKLAQQAPVGTPATAPLAAATATK